MIRYAAASDLPQIRALWKQGFGDEEPYTSWYFNQVWRPERTLLYLEQGQPVSSLQLAPYEISRKGQVLPAAYIVGVVTDQSRQGRGYARALLRQALIDLEGDGRALALLYTDIPGFYRPLGFTCCYSLRRLCFAAADSADAPEAEQVSADADALARCQAIYENMCQDLDGYVLRTETNWRTYVSDWLSDDHNGLYLGKGFYFLTDVFGGVFSLKEIGYRDETALKHALACCSALAAKQGFSRFFWDAPESVPLPRQRGETRRPWVMARVTGGGLTAQEAEDATLRALGAPDPRLWIGEIT